MALAPGKEVYATNEKNVLSSPVDCDVSNLVPCTQEEADTRLFLHVADAAKKGLKNVLVRTVDSDVVVLAVAVFQKVDLEEMWIAFGTGSTFCYIGIHKVVAALGPSTSDALLAFHSFTGCDTTSAFCGRGKKTAWDTWLVYPEVTEAFHEMLQMPQELSDLSLSQLERFVVLIYDRTSACVGVNEARKHLFTRKSRSLENIPPTQAALRQHIKRAMYQAHVWNLALVIRPQLPSPSDWGWVNSDDGWQPLWTTLPEASQSCYELLHCGCKKGCCGHCKCKKAELKCTALCACSGDCND